MITFITPGRAVAQGSKNAYRRGSRCILVDTNDKKLKPWRKIIADTATARGAKLIEAGIPVKVQIEFVFAQSKSNLKADGITPKKGAPLFPGHNCGDVDKLTRSVLDALTGIAYVDDTQVVSLDVHKRFGDDNYCKVSVWPLNG